MLLQLSPRLSGVRFRAGGSEAFGATFNQIWKRVKNLAREMRNVSTYPEFTFFSEEEKLQLLNGSCPLLFRTFGVVTSVNGTICNTVPRICVTVSTVLSEIVVYDANPVSKPTALPCYD